VRLRFFAAGALALALFSPLTLHAEARAPEVKLPELIAPLAPEYPSNGTRNQRVVLRVTLDTEGKVTGVDVTTGDEPYASAAVRAAQNGRFTPAERAGVFIPATILVAVDFTYSAPTAKPVSQTRVTPRSNAKVAKKELQPALQMVDGGPLDIVVTAPRVNDTEPAIQRAEARLMAGTFSDPLRAVELLPGTTPLIAGNSAIRSPSCISSIPIFTGYSRNLARGVDLENYLSVGAERARFNTSNESFKTHSIGVGVR